MVVASPPTPWEENLWGSGVGQVAGAPTIGQTVMELTASSFLCQQPKQQPAHSLPCIDRPVRVLPCPRASPAASRSRQQLAVRAVAAVDAPAAETWGPKFVLGQAPLPGGATLDLTKNSPATFPPSSSGQGTAMATSDIGLVGLAVMGQVRPWRSRLLPP